MHAQQGRTLLPLLLLLVVLLQGLLACGWGRAPNQAISQLAVRCASLALRHYAAHASRQATAMQVHVRTHTSR